MFGKFILECDPEFFDDAVLAAREMLDCEQNSMISTAKYPNGTEVHMFIRRLKRSISIKQIKP
jgi:hypothetical protein